MRFPAPLPAFLAMTLLAASASAAPIHVTLEDEVPGEGFGRFTFFFDPALQGPAPYDYPDIAEYSGDWVEKREDYRINVADYFLAGMRDWTGYGYDWLLERYPPGLGIYEDYAEVRLFGPAGQEMVMMGARTLSWAVGTPLGVFLHQDGGYRNASMRIAAIGEAEAVPEPASLALLGAGLAVLAAVARRRRA